MNVLMRQFIPGVIREMLERGPRSNQYFEMHSWAPFLKKKKSTLHFPESGEGFITEVSIGLIFSIK